MKEMIYTPAIEPGPLLALNCNEMRENDPEESLSLKQGINIIIIYALIKSKNVP
jgi:hypothetical protein